MRRNVFLAAQVAVTALLLVLLFRRFDWGGFDALFRRLPLSFYAGSLAIVAAGQLLYAWRWHVLLDAARVPVTFRRTIAQFLLGNFVNNFIPSNVGGDVARGYRLGREYGFHAVAATIVLDRILGISLLGALAAAAMWLSPSIDPVFRTVRLVMLLLAVGGAGALVVLLRGSGGLSRYLARFGPRGAVMMEHLRLFRLEMAPARNPVVLAKALAVVAGYFVLLTVAYEWFLDLQLGHAAAFVPVLAVVASAAALSNVPVSLNGLGLREQLHVILFRSLGVPKEAAVAISLLVFAHTWVLSLSGGFFWVRGTSAPSPEAVK